MSSRRFATRALAGNSSIRDEYRLYGIFEDAQCRALIGIRRLVDFLHGPHLYIDDLVDDGARRFYDREGWKALAVAYKKGFGGA